MSFSNMRNWTEFISNAQKRKQNGHRENTNGYTTQDHHTLDEFFYTFHFQVVLGSNGVVDVRRVHFSL